MLHVVPETSNLFVCRGFRVMWNVECGMTAINGRQTVQEVGRLFLKNQFLILSFEHAMTMEKSTQLHYLTYRQQISKRGNTTI